MFQACVSNVSDVFRLLLQVFNLDAAKVDMNVAYVAMAIHACLNYFIFSDVYCKSIIWMLHMLQMTML
jgi:hypothetical protein